MTSPWVLLNLLIFLFASRVDAAYHKSLCKQAGFVCFGVKNHETSWSVDSGCIKDDSCNVILFGELRDTSQRPRTEAIEWRVIAPYNDGRQEIFFTINEHPCLFDPKNFYPWARVKRLSTNIEGVLITSFFHTVNCQRSNDQITEIVSSNYADYGQEHTAHKTDAILVSPPEIGMKINENNFRPYVNLNGSSLFIHLKLIKNGAVVDFGSSKGHFKLFEGKTSGNNPDKSFDECSPWTDLNFSTFSKDGGTGPAVVCPSSTETCSACPNGTGSDPISDSAVLPEYCKNGSSRGSYPCVSETDRPVTIRGGGGSGGGNGGTGGNRGKGNSKTTTIIVVIVLLLLLLVGAALLAYYCCYKKRNTYAVTSPTTGTPSSDVRSEISVK